MAAEQHWFVTCSLVVSSIIAVTANLLLLVLFSRRRGLRSISNRFVINLLVTNLLSSILLVPLLIVDQYPSTTIIKNDEFDIESIINITTKLHVSNTTLSEENFLIEKTEISERKLSYEEDESIIISKGNASEEEEDEEEVKIIEENSSIFENVYVENEWLCYLAQCSTSLVCTTSIFSILLIGIDQYFAVIHSLRYHSYMNKFRSLILISTTWILSVLFAVIGVLTQTDSNFWKFCNKTSLFKFLTPADVTTLRTIYAFIYFTLVILLPFVAICSIYVCIYRAAHRNSARTRQATSATVDNSCLQLTSKNKELPKVRSAPNFVTFQTETKFTDENRKVFDDGDWRKRKVTNGDRNDWKVSDERKLSNESKSSKYSNSSQNSNLTNVSNLTNESKESKFSQYSNTLKESNDSKDSNGSKHSNASTDSNSSKDSNGSKYSHSRGSNSSGVSNRLEEPKPILNETTKRNEESNNVSSELKLLNVTKFKNEPKLCDSTETEIKVTRTCSERSGNFINNIKCKISNASIFKYREESRAAKISILVIFMVLICYIPYGLSLIFNNYTSRTFHYISLILLIISNTISPFLFAYRNRRVQRELYKFFGVKLTKNLRLHSSKNYCQTSLLRKRRENNINDKNIINDDVEDDDDDDNKINEPFIKCEIPTVIVTCKIDSDKKGSILKRVCSANWQNYKKCNFITVPDRCCVVNGEARGSFSSASTQISNDDE